MKKIIGILILMVICCLNLTADLNDGLVAYYTFNGNSNDESGNGFNGELFGSANVDSDFLEIGDNAEDAVSLPVEILNGLNNFTIACEVKINNFHTSGLYPSNTLISGALPYPNDNYFLLYYSAQENQWRFAIESNTIFFEANANIEDNQWHHITLLRENNNAKFYFDGELIGEPIECSDNSISIFDSSLFVGQDQDDVGGSGFTSNQSLAGCLDNMYFYNRTLTNDEIQALYLGFNANFLSPETAYIGEQIQFIDTSLGNITTWEWDFENDGINDLTYNSFQNTIYWIYENTGTFSVKLKISNETLVDSLIKSITVEYCPPASPEVYAPEISGDDVIISWAAVDTTECGSVVIPDGYVIQYSEVSQDSAFYYLWSVSNSQTNFTHIDVTRWSDQMFYKVFAFKDYNRAQIEYLESLNNIRKKLKWVEVKQNLKIRK